MKTRLLLIITALLILSSALSLADPLGTAFTYQGQLSSGGTAANGVYTFVFALYDAPSGGTQQGPLVATEGMSVTNGLFSVTLDFGSQFDGSARWLEIAVCTNGSEVFTLLAPRQPLPPSPYALYAPSAGTAVLASNAAPGSVGTAALAAGAVDSSRIASGAVVKTLNGLTDGVLLAAGSNVTLTTNGSTLTIAAAGGGGGGWSLTGNAGTAPGTNFLGTTDNQALEFKVNGQRGFRLQPYSQTNSYPATPNVIGGYSGNYVADSVMGATIAGGGAPSFLSAIFSNVVSASYASIGGGANNRAQATEVVIGGGRSNTVETNADDSTIAGGTGNTIRQGAQSSVIGGGFNNTIQTNADYSTIAGGQLNTVQTNADFCAIGGGWQNTVSNKARFATIGGGYNNSVSNNYSIVPGGKDNAAMADYSFAAGLQAKANHYGTFIWADSLGADFASATNDEFAVRARGGVRFVTSGAGLMVDGVKIASGTNSGGLSANCVYSTNIVDGEVKTADLMDGAVTSAKIQAGAVNNAALANSAVTASKIAASTIQASNVNAASFATTFWKTDGNAGTTPGTQFLGTTDLQALELKVNGWRALRLEPGYGTVSVIGGYSGNAVAPGTVAGTIGGGGNLGYANQVGGDYGVVAGGRTNSVNGYASAIGGGEGNSIRTFAQYCTISGGYQNTLQDSGNGSTIGGGRLNSVCSSASYAIVGGGYGNTIQSNVSYATIGGGQVNTNNAGWATIAGGNQNLIQTSASGSTVSGGEYNTIQTNANDSAIGGGGQNVIQTNADYCCIGGGYQNTIRTNGYAATIPGGQLNEAGASASLAAGYRAKARHNGAFVWADFQDADFVSTANGQFLIRAANGVGINTNNPQSALHVNGTATVSVLAITGGADIAEPFPISTSPIRKGAVVVIDEANPGRLKLSDSAYDTKVAGIVSGANGVNPGISLSQASLANGGLNVALSGRVYALADAANGPIRPGDLLTTSATPGHAMKVSDAGRAQGAILGKAMSSLNEGQGMVLVLVTLQ